MNEFINLFQVVNYTSTHRLGSMEVLADPFTHQDHRAFIIPAQGRQPVDVLVPTGIYDCPFVMVPPYTVHGYSELAVWGELDDDAFRLVIRAALYRNMVVFDSTAKPGEITSRFAMLLKEGPNRGRGKIITDLFINSEQPLTAAAFRWFQGIEVHPLLPNRWKCVRDYFFERGGHLAAGDGDLVIGICRDQSSLVRTIPGEHPDLVYHNVDTGLYMADGGLAIINSDCVLLGSY